MPTNAAAKPLEVNEACEVLARFASKECSYGKLHAMLAKELESDVDLPYRPHDDEVSEAIQAAARALARQVILQAIDKGYIKLSSSNQCTLVKPLLQCVQ